ncbi:hypothetical protein [Aminivibrio sp.]|uniref:hypothetical protein n=1 Tax=Aminivibrio sp. TaxID=1872489 RepID=UPI00345EF149
MERHGYAIEDVSIPTSFPNLTILQPSDEICARAIAKASVKFHGPLYIKVHKSPIPLVNTPEDYTYEIGKATKFAILEMISLFLPQGSWSVKALKLPKF